MKYNEAKILFDHLSNINLTESFVNVDETLNTARNLSEFIGNISKEVGLHFDLSMVRSYRGSTCS